MPDKRYSIVTELEKHAVVQNSANATYLLTSPNATPQLPKEKESISTELFKEKVDKLKILYDAGMLTDEEYSNAKSELLASIL